MTYRERKQALKTFISWVLWLSFKIIILYIIKNTCSYAGWTKTCMFQSPLSHHQSHPGKEKGMFPLRPFSLSFLPVILWTCLSVSGLSSSSHAPVFSLHKSHLCAGTWAFALIASFPHSPAKWTCCWSVKHNQILFVSWIVRFAVFKDLNDLAF